MDFANHYSLKPHGLLEADVGQEIRSSFASHCYENGSHSQHSCTRCKYLLILDTHNKVLNILSFYNCTLDLCYLTKGPTHKQ